MNPRFRRLLIPGLLVALLIVVLIGALTDRSDGSAASFDEPVESSVVSRIADPRIVESSGLAVSSTHDDLVYTVNDSGNTAVVYAVRLSTGQVVGTTRIEGPTWVDTEAMALHGDTLWVADTGDNAAGRSDTALYALPEPGPGDHVATPTRYPVSYEQGPQNVEALVVQPDSGRIMLFSKQSDGGAVLRLPKTLRAGAPNVAATTDRPTPPFTTDATSTPDGRHVLVRNYAVVEIRDAESWQLLRTDALPDQPQGETIAMEPSGHSYLVGSEGRNSALIRVVLDPEATVAPTPSPSSSPSAPEQPAEGAQVPLAVVIGVGALVAGFVAVLVLLRRSRHP